MRISSPDRIFVIRYDGHKYCVPGELCQDNQQVAASLVPGCKPSYNCIVTTQFSPPGMTAEEWIALEEPPCEALPTIYECPECGERFSSVFDRDQHIYEEHPPEPPPIYECPYCGAEFSSETSLQSHIEQEHPEPPPPPPPEYDCPYCAAVFNTAYQLEQHIDNFHASPPPPPPTSFECPYCGAAFPTEASLQWHIDQAHTEPPPTEPPPIEPPAEESFPWLWVVGIGAVASLAIAGLVLVSGPKSVRREAGKSRS